MSHISHIWRERASFPGHGHGHWTGIEGAILDRLLIGMSISFPNIQPSFMGGMHRLGPQRISHALTAGANWGVGRGENARLGHGVLLDLGYRENNSADETDDDC